MADVDKATDGPTVEDRDAWDYHNLPDYDTEFYSQADIDAFAAALSAPEISPSEEDLTNPNRSQVEFITALNDWKPVHQSVKGQQNGPYANRKGKRRKKPRRGKDETREGWTYGLVKYPLLFFVLGWLLFLGVAYMLTRFYIYAYERYVTWRGKRDRLRKSLRKSVSYEDWVEGAKELDKYLGSDAFKDQDEYAYYDDRTIRRARDRMRKARRQAEKEEHGPRNRIGGQRAVDVMVELAEDCIKHNFAGFENPRLYCETYYGTKTLVQDYIDEMSTSLKFLFASGQLTREEKRSLTKHLGTNFGRTALCLSGGAAFAYYHAGIAKALLDANLLPKIITGTSGGALVAAVLATRTDEELKKLLVPALAYRITACSDPLTVWLPRWWKTGARFDNVDWAKRCSWFCRGSMTFLEAYQRTGRILNVTCVPSDPHSPTILANYLTAPDCVIWSAVLASAAVPGILNPVVLMKKNRDGKLEPFSFGHKWKDGSLRTDIPLKALNLHFNVNFPIVSQVNPHINLFFFSSRGTVGRPVTHRRGRGWRGGFLGSAIEQYIKLDLTKWLKVLRHLELLPRPLGQDWSEIWLQRFSGIITIWPKSLLSDFYYILSDPTMQRLARMIHAGQLAAWPKLKFISNRMAIEKVIEDARIATRPSSLPAASETNQPREKRLRNVISEEDLEQLLAHARNNNGVVDVESLADLDTATITQQQALPRQRNVRHRQPDGSASPSIEAARAKSPSIGTRLTSWFSPRHSSTASPTKAMSSAGSSATDLRKQASPERRRSNVFEEFKRQSQVFFDDEELGSEEERSGENGKEVAPFEDGEGHDEETGSEVASEGESVVDE
ncbi:acyl transferase/acyl hydrolase/lysophospholipase [Neohortaea acidophila]|uniref:Patatin-like phospholipase domain-containing protein n=1 Tax=Neohortaea acidophila TaxID=245834 RepID=A0A6A6Q366_9PEZI|nr:acyl transferase/acyl hydrolase/lysophospholipase [Neohortaea acidophila]KAF2486481.1 acyl transferase/acyl hydrolase/lysophospholipase [Neohortaea acidophila]